MQSRQGLRGQIATGRDVGIVHFSRKWKDWPQGRRRGADELALVPSRWGTRWGSGARAAKLSTKPRAQWRNWFSASPPSAAGNARLLSRVSALASWGLCGPGSRGGRFRVALPHGPPSVGDVLSYAAVHNAPICDACRRARLARPRVLFRASGCQGPWSRPGRLPWPHSRRWRSAGFPGHAARRVGCQGCGHRPRHLRVASVRRDITRRDRSGATRTRHSCPPRRRVVVIRASVPHLALGLSQTSGRACHLCSSNPALK